VDGYIAVDDAFESARIGRIALLRQLGNNEPSGPNDNSSTLMEIV
jgi:hypothetical protein